MDFIDTSVLSILITRALAKRRRKRKYWVHPIYSERLLKGKFYLLYSKLRQHPLNFFKYFRMNVSTFDNLLKLVEPFITYQDTNFRKAIPAPERLAVTLSLDVLVNNAAVGARTTLELTDMETFDRVFNVNIRGVYNLTRLFVPALIKSKGNIINVSSVMATMVTKGNLPYSLSKAALDHFSRLAAFELAPKGVRVNVVSPGITVSTFVQRLTGFSDEEYRDWLKTAERSIPLGTASTGEDCAHTIAHLASDAHCRVVTGAVVPVDGAIQFQGAGSNSEVLREQVEAANK